MHICQEVAVISKNSDWLITTFREQQHD